MIIIIIITIVTIQKANYNINDDMILFLFIPFLK